jgi:hypothetical protein
MSTLNSGNSFDQPCSEDGSRNGGETASDGHCVHKHSGASGESDQVLLLAGNTARAVGSGFIFPALLNKLAQTPPDSLCTQSYFGWADRTPEEVDLHTFRAEAWFYTEGWTEKRLRTTLAFINKVLYHWGCGVGAIVEDGVRTVSKAIARTAIYSRSVLLCALTSVADYIRNLWGHAFSDRSLWGWIQQLKDDGFLDYASVAGEGKKSRQWLLSVPDLLLLAEACEKRLLWIARQGETDDDDYGFEWEAMPIHHGYTLKLLFDAVFPGFGWNRKGDDTQNEPTTYASTDECQQDEVDQHWATLRALRAQVLAHGWSQDVAAICDQLKTLWGPAWGVEALYERIVTRWDCWGVTV